MKVHLWRYVIAPAPDRTDMGGIVVMGSDGYFSSCSDFGNYAFMWRHHGEQDFRNFVLRCERDADYFINKLHYGVPRVYDCDASKKAVEAYVIDQRRGFNMSAEDARREWDWAQEAIGDSEEFGFWYRSTQIDEAWNFHVERDDWDVVNFVRRIMPRLCVLIRAEMAAEA